MPLWADLGRELEADLDDFASQSTLDTISAHEHAFGRPRLIERLSEILLLRDASPGDAHREFCSIPFDIVCTTNFDFLLERQYEVSSRFVYPVVDEDQLSLNLSTPGTLLLKLHGDLRHPSRLVVSEADYDGFLTRYPLLSTYLANQLITKTAVLIGYSLDDPDFRQVWQVVAQRLGRSRRNAYAIAVDAKPADVARFARRGVTVINIPGSKSRYGDILAGVFGELRDFYVSEVLSVSKVTEERPLRELQLPREALSRLCFFALPLDQLPLYRERIFPAIEAAGFVPVTADDIISPGDSTTAKIDALIDRAAAVVVEPTSAWTRAELELALGRQRRTDERRRPVVVISVLPSGQEVMLPTSDVVLIRGGWDNGEADFFADQIVAHLNQNIPFLDFEQNGESQRLLDAKEYRAAVISAMSVLEAYLRRRLRKPDWDRVRRPMSIQQLTEMAVDQQLLLAPNASLILEWSKIRNAVVHSGAAVSRAVAQQIVKGVQAIIDRAGRLA